AEYGIRDDLVTGVQTCSDLSMSASPRCTGRSLLSLTATISGQLLERLRQFVLCPPIVAVKERSDLPVHLGDADIERRGLAAVGFEKVPHPGSEFANNC